MWPASPSNSIFACTSDKEFLAEAVVWWGFARQSIWREEDAKYIALANPANIRVLVEALEKAQHEAAVDWEAAASLNVENQELKRRIAELESRTFTIEPFRSFVTDADLAALHRFAECCDDPESGGHDLEKEQVRRLESIRH